MQHYAFLLLQGLVFLTFLGGLLQIGEVVSVSRAHFEERHIELMEELHCHLKTEMVRGSIST